ncbi:MAG: arginine deiminase-related protein, partial [bacterium]
IRPKHFGFNEETATNNAFQINDKRLNPFQIAALALDEFDHFVEILKCEGLNITIIEDRDSPVISDSVFPNNWFSTHADGTVVTYPMFSKQRRMERREDIFDLLSEKYIISNRIHYEDAEENNQFLEGTGSLILDRSNKIVYACRSIRTNDTLLQKWAYKMNYK